MRVVSVLTLWSCDPFRCVVARYADPASYVVEVWKGVDTIHSVPCADTAAAATEAERLFHVYCETPDT